MEILAYGVDGEQKTGLANYLSCEYSEFGWQADEATVTIPAVQITAAAEDGRVTYNLRGYPVRDLIAVFDGTAMRFVKAMILSGDQSRAGATAELIWRQPTHTWPRHVIPPSGSAHDSFTGPGESALKHYMDTQRISPADSDRATANLINAADTAAGKTVDVDGRYQDLGALLDDAAKVGGVGHTVTFSDGQLVFEAVVGTNRTNDVKLSVADGTVSSEELLLDYSQYRNVAYVLGQGEGAARTVVEVTSETPEPTGWGRAETVVDARDTNDTGVLRSRGLAELTSPEHSIEVEINTLKLTAGEDFELMDQLRYVNQYGIDKTVRAVGVTRKFDESKIPDVTAHLDRPWPDVERRESALSGSQIE